MYPSEIEPLEIEPIEMEPLEKEPLEIEPLEIQNSMARFLVGDTSLNRLMITKMPSNDSS